jgi:gliding motility-associated-like protein
VATYDNPDGELMFYTNGRTVWNRNHEIMPILDTPVSDIGGDSTASQGVMIVPFMDDQTMFYIFTAQEVYGDFDYNFTYSIVDMKKDLANGAVLLHSLPLFDKSIEKITVSGFTLNAWLVSHEFGNNSYRSNLIDQNGISATTYTPLGEVLAEQQPDQATGYMTFGRGTSFFANVIPEPNLIDIFDFNNGTGRMENVRRIETNESDDLYGLEFSGGGSKLYVTTSNNLLQFNLDSLGTDDEIQHIEDSKYDGYPSSPDYGALELGPNGIIYMAIDEAVALGSISTPDAEEATANFNATGLDLLGYKSRLGLPGFIQNAGPPLQAPGMAFLNACFGQTTRFFATGTSPIDEFFWTFYDSLSLVDTIGFGNGQSVSQTYDQTGMHIFTLNITNRCGYDSIFVDTLDVYSIPEIPLVPDDTTLCNGALELQAWDEERTDLTYYWSTGETTRTIQIVDPVTLNVAIISTDGCSSDTLEVFVGDGRPALDLGPDLAYCQFEPVPDLDTYNNDLLNHQWTINGADADTTRNQIVFTSLPGFYEYAVYIQDPTGGCVNTDTININIREAPDVTPSYISPTECGFSDAIINLEINSLGSYRYDFSGMGQNSSGSIDGPNIVPSIGGLAAGTYSYTITDLITTCDITHPVLIDDDVPFSLSATNLPLCEIDANLRLTISGLALPPSVNIYITDLSGDTVYSEPGLYVPISVTPLLDSGLYFTTVQDVTTGCFQSDSVHIRPLLPGETDCIPGIFAPNAFSPNGNCQNEEFFVYPNAYVDQFEIFIYSRWGELIYHSTNKNFRWDGKFNDRKLGPATYAYIIKYTSAEAPGQGTITQYGSVTLVK